MPRYGRYLRLEKNIAASDTGGILERWTFGRRLLADDTATYPVSGNLRPGVLAKYIGTAKAAGFKLSEREIQYRLRCARAYETEAEVRKILAELENWWGLIQAGFPPVELPEGADPGNPYDPRDADERRRDLDAERKRREAVNPAQGSLFEWNPPEKFNGDEHGPQTSVKELYAACESSEAYTARMAEMDERRRGYVDELAAAVGGDTDKTWYEAEMRRRGLDAVGLADWDSFDEIMRDFFGLYDGGAQPDDEDEDGGE